MRPAARFLAVLLGALGVLALVGYLLVSRTLHGWFRSDVTLRSQLAVASARQGLESAWGMDSQRLLSTLVDITRDERVMGAAACSAGGVMLAATDAYPREFSCREILSMMRRDTPAGATSWSTTRSLPSGFVHLGVSELRNADTLLGTIVLVHDLGYLERRESRMRAFVLSAFFLLSLLAAAVTLIAARVAWRGWTSELQRALSGRPTEPFKPLLRDVRALVARLTEEGRVEERGGRWTPERLKSALTQHLHGERVIMLANREPYIHERSARGIDVLHPASGLVTALEPVMRACSGVWVAHGSGSADRETVDAEDHVAVPPGEGSYQLRRVWLSEEEEKGYYYGFSNEGLWPLCHLAHARPTFRAADFEHYVRVNRRFADAVCDEVDTDDPIILVQDYHFALAPRMIRERLPRATIITFWHIPWPNAERVGICPWRQELISGLLGSSILGFHTRQHCNNFVDSVDAFLESRIDREENAVIHSSRRTLVRPYPISIEWPVHWLDAVPSVALSRLGVRTELGLAPDALLGVGVDRLDYTKGIEERLVAVDELLEHHAEFRGRFTFVQLAAPSRTKIARYGELNARVEEVAEGINRKWGRDGYQPIVLLRSHHEPSTVFRYYRAADVCYVSSLHDGMNLVAKEFVAARDDCRGVLVLSQFTGAARELTEALIVNPYDPRAAAEALAMGLRMSSEEQQARMSAMRRLISEFNVYRWAGRMLVDAAELRRRERLHGRFSGNHSSPGVRGRVTV